MHAWVLTGHGGPETLEYREVDRPEPGPGRVRVEVRAAALNNTDVWTRTGAYGLPGDPDAAAGWRGPVAFPRIQGGDVAGVVDATGPGVDGDLHGRRVLVDPGFYDGPGPDAHPVGLIGSEADGGFAGYVVVGADRVHDMTGSPLSDAELAALPVAYGTAAGMLERAGIGSGETVVVTGASGGVGLALVQLATARGARVLAVTSPRNAGAVRSAGAVEVLDRSGGADAVAAAVPDGVDAVADVAGGDLVAALLPRVRDGGRWVVAGAVAGPVVPFDLRRLYLHNISLIGSSMHTPAHFERLADDARSGAVRPVIAARFAPDALPAAQEEFLHGGRAGKIVLTRQA
ncbi:zinc-binding dehydrogenase [Pseudonocardia sp. HH130630-07]|uniref:zinc-binding dehydrogenase n=1 Tax=Pseudonocardia sp. HH130630-07 TaxID=1690815 RepID=UPI000814C45E|nr:zinc-binding dehydrogenase [Pseudonocardia sp. HH130630-07]ANY10457.1 Zn-dependent oxidoreductase [Pseudonocardia sp. HH130630-07]